MHLSHRSTYMFVDQRPVSDVDDELCVRQVHLTGQGQQNIVHKHVEVDVLSVALPVNLSIQITTRC